MLHDVFGRPGADRGTALVFFSPGALVLSLVYTEAATILLVACTLMALRRQPLGGGRPVRRRGHHGRPGGGGRGRALRGGRRAWPSGAGASGGRWRPRSWPRSASSPSSPTCGPTPARPSSTSGPSGPAGRAAPTSAGSPGRSSTCSATGSPTRTTPSRRCRPWWPWPCWSIFFRARPPATWIGYVRRRAGLRGHLPGHRRHPPAAAAGLPPARAWSAPGCRPLWFEAVLGLSALCMAALAVASLGSPAFTP